MANFPNHSIEVPELPDEDNPPSYEELEQHQRFFTQIQTSENESTVPSAPILADFNKDDDESNTHIEEMPIETTEDIGTLIQSNGRYPITLTCPKCSVQITTRVKKLTNWKVGDYSCGEPLLMDLFAVGCFVISILGIVLAFLFKSAALKIVIFLILPSLICGGLAAFSKWSTSKFYADVYHYCPLCDKELGKRDGYVAMKKNRNINHEFEDWATNRNSMWTSCV